VAVEESVTSEVGSWPEEAAKLFAALQERVRGVDPQVYSHLGDAVASLAAAIRLLTAAPGADDDRDAAGPPR
jgi:hypothetical protein